MPRTNANGLTVAALIEELQEMDPNAEVHMTYNYGDHWRTTVAPSIEYIEAGRVTYSDYHSMDKVVDDEEEDSDEVKNVVLLHS